MEETLLEMHVKVFNHFYHRKQLNIVDSYFFLQTENHSYPCYMIILSVNYTSLGIHKQHKLVGDLVSSYTTVICKLQVDIVVHRGLWKIICAEEDLYIIIRFEGYGIYRI